MSGYQGKITRNAKRQKTVSRESTNITSVPDSDVAEMLESSEQEFKTTMMKMPRAPRHQAKGMDPGVGPG